MSLIDSNSSNTHISKHVNIEHPKGPGVSEKASKLNVCRV